MRSCEGESGAGSAHRRDLLCVEERRGQAGGSNRAGGEGERRSERERRRDDGVRRTCRSPQLAAEVEALLLWRRPGCEEWSMLRAALRDCRRSREVQGGQHWQG